MYTVEHSNLKKSISLNKIARIFDKTTDVSETKTAVLKNYSQFGRLKKARVFNLPTEENSALEGIPDSILVIQEFWRANANLLPNLVSLLPPVNGFLFCRS